MMTEIITYFFIAIVSALIGLFIGKLLSKLNFEKDKTALEKEKSTLEERLILLQPVSYTHLTLPTTPYV